VPSAPPPPTSPGRAAPPAFATPRAVRVPQRTQLSPEASAVPARVREAMRQPSVDPRDPSLAARAAEVRQLLRYAFRTTHRATGLVGGPVAWTLEACAAALVAPGATALVCGAGGGSDPVAGDPVAGDPVAGDPVAGALARRGARVVRVAAEAHRAVTPGALNAALAAHPSASLVAFAHVDPATGAQADAAALARVARAHGARTLVDASASLGCVPVEAAAWGLDAVYAGAGQGLSGPSGVTALALGPRAEAAVRRSAAGGPLDLRPWRAGEATHALAPPAHALYGVHEALRALHVEGLEAAWTRHRRMGATLAAGLRALGLRLPVARAVRAPHVLAVAVPDAVDADAVRAELRQRERLVVGAGGGAAPRTWRIGLLGHSARLGAVYRCLHVLAATLTRHGYRADGPAAVEAAAAHLRRLQRPAHAGDGARTTAPPALG
jgi:alanine-glyoxylate transaminase/serine-glyoxylate transaminase/serine-pyruvate transaminase